MALTFDLAGEQMPTSFSAGIPALATLQPLQFVQSNVPAIQFQPNQAAEKIAAGITRSAEAKQKQNEATINTISTGITAAFKSKREDEKEKAKLALESQKEDAKFKRDIYLKNLELSNAGIKHTQSVEDAKDLYLWKIGVNERVPPKTSKHMPQLEGGEGGGQPGAEQIDGPFRSIDLNDQFEEGAVNQDQPPTLDLSRNPLSNITKPVQGNAVDVMSELSKLGPIDAKYLSASTGRPTTLALPVGQATQMLRKPNTFASQLGGAAPADYTEASNLLKTMNTPDEIASLQAKYPVNPATPLSSAVVANERPPRTGFQSEQEALDYIQKHPKNSGWFAKESPTFDSGTGTFWVKWEQKDPAVAAKNADTMELSKKRLERLDQAGLASEVNNFLKDPINKLMQARPMQIAEFQAVYDEAFDPATKKSRRAVDLDAIDKFVMFARGTQPTEAQYSEIQNWTQGYLNDVKQKIDKGVEGARLSPEDYETMQSLMYRAYNTTASLINPEIKDIRDVVKAKHPSLMDQELPREHMYYEVPSYFREKLGEAQEEMRQYHSLMDLAKNQNNKQAFADAKAKYEDAEAAQNKSLTDLAQAKASKKPLNQKSFKRGGWKQGLFGGVSDIGGTGSTQETP